MMPPSENHDPLRVLPREIPPPETLEARVRRSLRRRGLLGRGRAGRTMRAILSLAAALTLLATGYWFGRRPGTASELAPEGRRYALLLYEDPAFRPDASDAQLVTEYSAWAVSLRHEGHLQLGEKLADAETILELSADSITAQPSPVRAGMGSVAGFFIIHARSDAEALAIARACPHLKYGGRIGLRAIEET